MHFYFNTMYICVLLVLICVSCAMITVYLVGIAGAGHGYGYPGCGPKRDRAQEKVRYKLMV